MSYPRLAFRLYAEQLASRRCRVYAAGGGFLCGVAGLKAPDSSLPALVRRSEHQEMTYA